MNQSAPTYVPEAFNFQSKSKNGAIKVFKDGDISVLGIKLGIGYQIAIKELSKNYKIEYASSPDKNIIQVENICINPRATSCMVCFDFDPTTDALESITLVSKYATNFCWCFREMRSTRFIEFSESTSNNNNTYWFNTEKCQIKISCYSFESSGKTIDKQLVKITSHKSNKHPRVMKQPVRQMSDRRFKWLLIVASLTIIIVAAIWKYPDAIKAHENRQVKLGEYVYVDPRSIIHVSRKCPKLNYKGFKSERVRTEDLRRTVLDSQEDFTVCPHCVSDKDYEELSRRIN